MEKDLRGTVKWFDMLRGYGFLKLDGTDADYFMHKKDVVDKGITKGDKVMFDEKEGQKGIVACFVRKVKLY